MARSLRLAAHPHCCRCRSRRWRPAAATTTRATRAAATAQPTPRTATEPTPAEAAEALKDTSTKPVIPKPTGSPPRKLVDRGHRQGQGPGRQARRHGDVNYVGMTFSTGEEFDASWDRGQPFPVPLGSRQVIAGWTRGLVGIRKGGRRMLTIPPELGYGSEGYPPASRRTRRSSSSSTPCRSTSAARAQPSGSGRGGRNRGMISTATIAVMISAAPSQPIGGQALVVQEPAEQAREGRLGGEDQRGPRRRRVLLGEGLDEEAERARDQRGHDQRRPDRRALAAPRGRRRPPPIASADDAARRRAGPPAARPRRGASPRARWRGCAPRARTRRSAPARRRAG